MRAQLLALALLAIGSLGYPTSTVLARAKPRNLRTLTLPAAEKIVVELTTESATSMSSFPLVMNEQVLAMLNSYLTSKGRVQHLKDTLKLMKTYQPMIEEKIKAKGLPPELMVIPMIESGFKNITAKPDVNSAGKPRDQGAGIWMLVKRTGRSMGLKVNAETDQRLDPAAATDAALKLLKRHHREFGKDWLLALAAYQQGTGHVRDKIKLAGHRDAWQLMQEKHITDYIARAMALSIILKKPELLN